MKVKALKFFNDKKEKVPREKNDVFEVSKERFKEINSTKYGKLVTEVKESKPKKETKK